MRERTETLKSKIKDRDNQMLSRKHRFLDVRSYLTLWLFVQNEIIRRSLRNNDNATFTTADDSLMQYQTTQEDIHRSRDVRLPQLKTKPYLKAHDKMEVVNLNIDDEAN